MIRGDIAENGTVKPVGKCIYCGSTENLRDEHCIPESLNGVRVCWAKVTSGTIIRRRERLGREGYNG